MMRSAHGDQGHVQVQVEESGPSRKEGRCIPAGEAASFVKPQGEAGSFANGNRQVGLYLAPRVGYTMEV
jgi:hypothetical protein